MTSVRVRPELSEAIREVENVFIPMADGTRLAARLFLPPSEASVPALLEYIPYRKRDFMRARDEPMHRYFAAHGYAVVRVDVRGTGDSDGVLEDEYSEAELEDGVQLIDWIARQPFCNGRVGMMGISWGGFNALQLAARRPSALQAILTLCASDDRYADDAHYMGGCLLNENMQWGSILMTYAALPPDPAIVGDRWRAMWQERLENLTPFPALWMQHPLRDGYWRRGSVCEDYRAIQCPVYAIGGWADGYSNAVARLLAGLPGIRKGLIGPWAHTFPHRGYPGPAIGFLQEALRWWDRWLKDADNGIEHEPMLRAWMQESVPPAPHYDVRPGRWVSEDSWPSPRIEPRQWFLNRRHLAAAPSHGKAIKLRSPQVTGAVSGEWCAFGAPGEMPLDQRSDDGRSLVFDSEPLEQPLEILGAAEVTLELSSSAPCAMLAVRLNEVAADGASTRVTYGLLDLTHREGHERSVPLPVGERVRVRVQLNQIAHRFSVGHRIRVAISTAYWPLAWPSPQAGSLSIWPGVSSLSLPVRPSNPKDMDLPGFLPPEEASGIQHEPIRALPLRRTVQRDLVTNEVSYTLTSDGGELGGHRLARLEEIDLTLGAWFSKRHSISSTDPTTAKTWVEQWVELSRGLWKTRIETQAHLYMEGGERRFQATVRAYAGDQQVFERHFQPEAARKPPVDPQAQVTQEAEASSTATPKEGSEAP